MQKTIHFALFLFIVTGLLFSACTKVPESLEEDGMEGSLEESLEFEEEDDEDMPTVSPSEETPSENSAAPAQESAYVEGSYTQTANYMTPAGQETVGVTLTLDGEGIIQSVSVQNLAKDDTSQFYVGKFTEGISAVVVGKDIDSLGTIGAVNGSSLTPNAFNTAALAIRTEAQDA